MLHIATWSCNLQWFQNDLCSRCRKQNRALLFAIFASPRELQGKLLIGHVTRCNLPAACLATPLQHKLKRKLHRITLAVKLGSTFSTIAEIFLNRCKLHPETKTCFLKPLEIAARHYNVLDVSCNLQLTIPLKEV